VQPRSTKKPMFFSLKKQVCFLDLSSIFLVFLMNLAFRRLTPFGSVLIFSGKTLVTLSSKEKDSLETEASPSSLGLGIGSSTLEPGTRLSYLTCSKNFWWMFQFWRLNEFALLF
jgi:hypothetical protein